MPCSDAMITDVVSVAPNLIVADAMALFEKYSIRAVPVVDEKNIVIGMFSFKTLLMELLPASMNTEAGERMGLEFSLDAFQNMGPFVAKSLQRVMALKIQDVMVVSSVVNPDTALREGMRLLALHGSPIPVVEEETNKLIGLISAQFTIKALLKMQKDLEMGVKVDE